MSDRNQQVPEEEDDLKGFTTGRRRACERGRIFVAMPLNANHSNALWELIQHTCSIHQFSIHRGNTSHRPSSITAAIIDEIERAEIVIADLTARNPNVLYELGLAHMLCDALILVAQQGEKLPFDLQDFRCIFFDLTQNQGHIEFSTALGNTLESIRANAPPIVIDDPIRRTREIIADLETLLRGSKRLKEEKVWYSGFLSSFAIGPGDEFDGVEAEYQKALLEEKEALLKLAQEGCQMYCIISPPAHDLIVERARFANARISHLLKFLESGDSALENIYWATSPFRQKNMHIIGRISYFEGFSRPLEPGYGLTLRQSSPDAIAANISLYETLFKTLSDHTKANYPSAKGHDEKAWLRQATVQALRQALTACDEEEVGG